MFGYHHLSIERRRRAWQFIEHIHAQRQSPEFLARQAAYLRGEA